MTNELISWIDREIESLTLYQTTTKELNKYVVMSGAMFISDLNVYELTPHSPYKIGNCKIWEATYFRNPVDAKTACKWIEDKTFKGVQGTIPWKAYTVDEAIEISIEFLKVLKGKYTKKGES